MLYAALWFGVSFVASAAGSTALLVSAKGNPEKHPVAGGILGLAMLLSLIGVTVALALYRASP